MGHLTSLGKILWSSVLRVLEKPWIRLRRNQTKTQTQKLLHLGKCQLFALPERENLLKSKVAQTSL